MSSETKLDLEAIRTRKLKAENLITELCNGGRWRMSIPVQDGDSDVVMQSALNDVSALIVEVERLREQSVQAAKIILETRDLLEVSKAWNEPPAPRFKAHLRAILNVNEAAGQDGD